MRFLRRLLRKRNGQTTSEYMILLSVVAIGAMAAFATFVNGDGPVQTEGEAMAQNFTNGLTNADGSTMHVQ